MHAVCLHGLLQKNRKIKVQELCVHPTEVEMPIAALGCMCYWIMAASVCATGEVVGTCTTDPLGVCSAHLMAVWKAHPLGAGSGTPSPRPVRAVPHRTGYGFLW